jgi:hypothetical protein
MDSRAKWIRFAVYCGLAAYLLPVTAALLAGWLYAPQMFPALWPNPILHPTAGRLLPWFGFAMFLSGCVCWLLVWRLIKGRKPRPWLCVCAGVAPVWVMANAICSPWLYGTQAGLGDFHYGQIAWSLLCVPLVMLLIRFFRCRLSG